MVLVGRPRVELGISDYLTTPNYSGTRECLWSGAHLHHFRCAIICSLRAQTFCLIPSVLSFQSSKGVSPILSRPLAWFLFPSKAHILSKSPGITVYLSAHHCDIILRKIAEAARVELACELPHDSFPSCFLTIRNTLPNKCGQPESNWSYHAGNVEHNHYTIPASTTQSRTWLQGGNSSTHFFRLMLPNVLS